MRAVAQGLRLGGPVPAGADSAAGNSVDAWKSRREWRQTVLVETEILRMKDASETRGGFPCPPRSGEKRFKCSLTCLWCFISKRRCPALCTEWFVQS